MKIMDLILDLWNIVIITGVVSFFWFILTKYDLHYKILGWIKKIPVFENSELEVCVLCTTFWLCYVAAILSGWYLGSDLSVKLISLSILKAVISVPLVVNLVKHQFDA